MEYRVQGILRVDEEGAEAPELHKIDEIASGQSEKETINRLIFVLWDRFGLNDRLCVCHWQQVSAELMEAVVA